MRWVGRKTGPFLFMKNKCNLCGAVESEVAILFCVICANCYLKLPFEARRQVLEEAARALAKETV